MSSSLPLLIGMFRRWRVLVVASSTLQRRDLERTEASIGTEAPTKLEPNCIVECLVRHPLQMFLALSSHRLG